MVDLKEIDREREILKAKQLKEILGMQNTHGLTLDEQASLNARYREASNRYYTLLTGVSFGEQVVADLIAKYKASKQRIERYNGLRDVGSMGDV